MRLNFLRRSVYSCTMNRPRRAILLAITAWLTMGLAASPARCATALQRLRQLCHSPTTKRLHLGVRVVELAGKRELFALHADERFIPASNQKLVTTSAAVSLLGAGFEYRTVLAALGNDLVVFASGDPTIGDPVLAERDGRGITALFEEWAGLLKKRNLNRIAGDLCIDPSVFEKQYVHPSWQAKDLHRWYAAEVAGANFFDNCIELKLRASAPGRLVSYTLRPNSRYVTVENSCRSVEGRGKQSIWLSRVLGTRAKLHWKENGHTQPELASGQMTRPLQGMTQKVVTAARDVAESLVIAAWKPGPDAPSRRRVAERRR